MSMRYGPVELSVPPGFQNILHLISQEVLRTKPPNTLEFISGFLDDLITIREESGYDPVTHGEMIDRVREQYWKIQNKRKNRPQNGNDAVEKIDDKKPEINDGSGDVGMPTCIAKNAEVLVTIAMHQDDGEGKDKETEKPLLVVEQQESVAEQPETAVEEQEGECVADTIDGEVEQGESLTEGQDEGMQSTAEEVTIATEEQEKHLEDAGELEQDE